MIKKIPNKILKIIRGFLVSVTILFLAVILSFLYSLFQIMCPTLFLVFWIIVILVIGFKLADEIMR